MPQQFTYLNYWFGKYKEGNSNIIHPIFLKKNKNFNDTIKIARKIFQFANQRRQQQRINQ